MFLETLISDKNLLVNTTVKELESLNVPSTSSKPIVQKVNPVPVNNLSSDYPSIDNLVKSQIGSGVIRKITFHENKGTTNKPMLLYEIERYNFCDHVNRNHKRNRIYFIGDVKRMCIYKKCHDPNCVDYRGYDIFVDCEKS